jgi:hypothetical protein
MNLLVITYLVLAQGHPDLSGTWANVASLPLNNLARAENGAVSNTAPDRGVVRPAVVAGALESTRTPSYKPEFQERVKFLSENESKTDPVFYCGRPGVPRIGPPRRIVQLPNDVIFLYEDISGNTFRVIPIDGRPHNERANPSYYGDSVGRWEGEKLVIDVRNFVEDTWFGEEGYFHSDALQVTERLWRDGENLVYQATVSDPKVLTAPWTVPPRVVKPSSDPIEESPPCIETDGPRLLNNDHHQQR